MGWKEGSAEKIMLHGLIGGIMADINGGKFGEGLTVGAINEILIGQLSKLTKKDEKGKDVPLLSSEQMRWISAIVGGVVSEATGGNAAQGGSIADSATRNNYLTHEQSITRLKEEEACNNDTNCLKDVRDKWAKISETQMGDSNIEIPGTTVYDEYGNRYTIGEKGQLIDIEGKISYSKPKDGTLFKDKDGNWKTYIGGMTYDSEQPDAGELYWSNGQYYIVQNGHNMELQWKEEQTIAGNSQYITIRIATDKEGNPIKISDNGTQVLIHPLDRQYFLSAVEYDYYFNGGLSIDAKVQMIFLAESAGARITISFKQSQSITLANNGHTGRFIAENFNEQLAMKQVLSEPLQGARKVDNIVLRDPRWSANEGWIKMENVVRTPAGEKITVHFVYNPRTNLFDDFKFPINK